MFVRTYQRGHARSADGVGCRASPTLIEGSEMAHDDVGDIRAVSPAEHWAHFEHAWTTLLSYRYLGKETPYLDRASRAR